MKDLPIEAIRTIEHRLDLITLSLTEIAERQRRLLQVQTEQEIRLQSILATLRSDLRARRRLEAAIVEPDEEPIDRPRGCESRQ
jgi:uncharacterized protein YajQ (UPF0234 family)